MRVYGLLLILPPIPAVDAEFANSCTVDEAKMLYYYRIPLPSLYLCIPQHCLAFR